MNLVLRFVFRWQFVSKPWYLNMNVVLFSDCNPTADVTSQMTKGRMQPFFTMPGGDLPCQYLGNFWYVDNLYMFSRFNLLLEQPLREEGRTVHFTLSNQKKRVSSNLIRLCNNCTVWIDYICFDCIREVLIHLNSTFWGCDDIVSRIQSTYHTLTYILRGWSMIFSPYEVNNLRGGTLNALLSLL